MRFFTRPSAQPCLQVNDLPKRFTPSVTVVDRSLLPVTGLTFLMTMGLMTISGHAQAQNINGIFGSRSSEQFFQAGIARLEQDIDELIDETEVATLNIDESVNQQRRDLQEDELESFVHVDSFSTQEDELQ